ncbi:putative serine/threonine-protein kinase [Apostasia shenzhenica]|uniref:Putative serine/threonine-protein kinase n=1 Tax=Apostasia shenzhenica TaxID=1088818 RepID=A0A2I0B1Q9_9ASPA|nr:putative serine/threonine-protein kinase [Apostasia shenzhenica]
MIPSSSSTIILLFLFSSALERLARAVNPQFCDHSSCEELQISYPFRLKGDPAICGFRDLELACRGNRTFMEIQSSEYLVNNIDYLEKNDMDR